VSDIAVTADQIGTIITYIAPGFLAREGYRTRLPGNERQATEVVLLSVAVSLPIVSLFGAILPGAQSPTQAGYVAALLAFSFVAGYVLAAAGSTHRVRRWLAITLGHELAAPGSVYTNVFRGQSEEAGVTVVMKDGKRYSGAPRFYPSHQADGVAEIYLTYPQLQASDGSWGGLDGNGLILPLGEVAAVVLSEDSTNAEPR
jgi:hypothetical protein